MQVILLEDVRALGRKGDLVNVSDGYARNFLLPRKKGIEANNKNMNDLKLKQAQDARTEEANRQEAEKMAELLREKKIVVRMKTGNNGKLFGSVSTKDISEAIKDQLDLDIDKKKIVLTDNMKELGEYKVSVKLFKGIAAELAVSLEEL